MPDEVQTAIFVGSAFYYGGQGGVAVGYRKVFFGGRVDDGPAFRVGDRHQHAGVPTRTPSISGFVTYPALALMGEF